MVMKFMEGDLAGAARLQLEAVPLINALFCEVNPIPVKTALNLMGWKVGPTRMPLCEMEPENEERLKKLLLITELSLIINNVEIRTEPVSSGVRQHIV